MKSPFYFPIQFWVPIFGIKVSVLMTFFLHFKDFFVCMYFKSKWLWRLTWDKLHFYFYHLDCLFCSLKECLWWNWHRLAIIIRLAPWKGNKQYAGLKLTEARVPRDPTSWWLIWGFMVCHLDRPFCSMFFILIMAFQCTSVSRIFPMTYESIFFTFSS